MKGEIVSIKTVFNDDMSVNCYEVVVDVIEKPNLKIGECDISQEVEK